MRPPGPGWPMPPPPLRPQQWYPQNPALPQPQHLGYRPQPLFPVHGMTMPTQSPVVSGVAPPGIPSSSPAMTVPQPLFPVVSSSTPSQASPFSAPLPVGGGVQQPPLADATNAYPPNNSFPCTHSSS